ncbi:MAG TPA: histidine kinase [Terriglobales bacterium]|jgi:two-component system, LytTR family, sensor kinase|nr:histidine kinase [Terriglobales bacterium]
MTEQPFIWVMLLVKLGVAAAVASAVVRSVEFKNLLFREERTTRQKIYLMLWFAVPITIGVWIRFIAKSFYAGDISLETTLLLGAIGGRVAGISGGILLAIPAVIHGEWATLPFNVLCGFLAGQLRQIAADKEAIWTFSPFVDLSIYRWLKRNLPKPLFFDWQNLFFATILVMRFIQGQLARYFPSSIFSVESPNLWKEVAIYATSIMTIGIELKIFQSVRIQKKLEEQEKLLLQARMEALQNQINPHFLFNTLNSVSSLVRFDPDTARELIIKLATILRRLLNNTEAFVPLRDELEFIDNYLDIEVVRFGPEKLRVVKEVEPASMDVMVPSMILQPLVENSIKHGISPKIEGGSVFLRSRLANRVLVVEVEDDGVGIDAAANILSADHDGMGIGMANVVERLKVLYGDTATMTIDSQHEKGTLVRLRLPLLQERESLPALLYEERSSTRR